MNIHLKKIIGSALFLAMLLLTACSGSGGGGGNGGGGVTAPKTHAIGGSIQGQPLSLRKTVSTYVGAPPGADGTGGLARFYEPAANVSDGTNLYVADKNNHTIRKIVIATGVVTTLAGQAGVSGATDGIGTAATFNYPWGITTDGTNLYVADMFNLKIRRIVISTGVVSSLTGTANIASDYGAMDGTGTTATFAYPYGITTDGINLYVVDRDNCKIRKVIIATGVVSSLTGAANTAVTAGAADGTGVTATFNYPYDITTDGTNLYVADTDNNKIRQIVIATGVVSSLTGTANTASAAGAADGAGTTATFNAPTGITTDGTNLYVADRDNHKIRQIVISSGAVSSVTGAVNMAGAPGAMDGVAATASFSYPLGITTYGGNLYLVDTVNHTIRKIALSGLMVSTLAGPKPGANGIGAAAAFNYPSQIATDGINLYVADSSNHTIRQIVISTGAVSTLAGQTGVAGAADGIGTMAKFNYPRGITTDGLNLYVADTQNHKIRQIVIATGVVSSLTGTANTTSAGTADGAGSTATFNYPTGITTDGINLYVADSQNQKIRQIVIATGVVSSLTGAANTMGTAGATDGAATTATFDTPSGLTTDGTKLYVADSGNNKIRQIIISTGVVSSLTGTASTAGTPGAADGADTSASFNFPRGITTDGTKLYVADMYNHKIRQIVINSGVVSSVTGTTNTAGTPSAADGAGATASFGYPFGITTDGINLYVADMGNNSIRKIE